jgi:hypothetical protein
MARLLPTMGRFTQRMPLVYRPLSRLGEVARASEQAEAHEDGRVTAVFSWQLPFAGFPAPSGGRHSRPIAVHEGRAWLGQSALCRQRPCPVTLVKLQAEEPKV